MPARLIAMVTALAVGVAIVLVPVNAAQADTSPAPGEPETYAIDALPTVQHDGVAWAQVIIGNTVYVGGDFQKARPAGAAAGTSETARPYMLAYNLSTGELINGFAPQFNGQVLGLAASPDGSRLYAVGDFTQVNGLPRFRIVALDPGSGEVSTTFTPGADFRVRSVVATNSTVYVGGSFNAIGSTSRTRLAALSAANGSVLPWAPAATGGNQVTALTLTGDGSKLIAAGNFTAVNGQSTGGLAAIDPVTGQKLPWAAGNAINNASSRASFTSLTSFGDLVFGGGYKDGTLNGQPSGDLEGQFAAEAGSGAVRWVNGCHGDTYGMVARPGILYAVGHSHDCRDIGSWEQTNPWTFKRATAVTMAVGGVNQRNATADYKDWAGTPAPTMLNFFPTIKEGTFTGQAQGAWTVAANDDYLVIGGEFPKVNGANQQGLVRFARKGLAPNKEGPELHGANYKPGLVSPAPGVVRGSILSNYDFDNETLSYRVFRQGVPDPITTRTIKSNFFKRQMLVFSDSGLTPGQTYNYRVSVSDPMGNLVTGDWTPVTVSGSGTLSTYQQRVMDAGPMFYWRLGESSGSSANDAVGHNRGTMSGSFTRGAAGAIAGDSDTATTFTGNSSASRVHTSEVVLDQQRFAVEAWLKTTTTKGGRIIGFGNGTSGTSGKSDRHVYMQNDGRLTFGVSALGNFTVTSPAAYNDGKYHHVVAQLSSAGMQLYVDGVLVGSNTVIQTANEYNGYWRVGGDDLSGWPNRPTSNDIAATIDDVAVYPNALPVGEIRAHYTVGTGGVAVNEPPTAAFTMTANDLTVAVNANGSSDPDGFISSYSWNFGDGTTATGATASRTYAVAGTYQIRLTVTDNQGATATTTQSVTVPPPGRVAPPAATPAVPKKFPTKTITVGKNKIKKFSIAGFTNANKTAKKIRVRVRVSTKGTQGKLKVRTPGKPWKNVTVKKARAGSATVLVSVTSHGRIEVRNLSNRKLKIKLVIDQLWIAGAAGPLTLRS